MNRRKTDRDKEQVNRKERKREADPLRPRKVIERKIKRQKKRRQKEKK